MAANLACSLARRDCPFKQASWRLCSAVSAAGARLTTACRSAIGRQRPSQWQLVVGGGGGGRGGRGGRGGGGSHYSSLWRQSTLATDGSQIRHARSALRAVPYDCCRRRIRQANANQPPACRPAGWLVCGNIATLQQSASYRLDKQGTGATCVALLASLPAPATSNSAHLQRAASLVASQPLSKIASELAGLKAKTLHQTCSQLFVLFRCGRTSFALHLRNCQVRGQSAIW